MPKWIVREDEGKADDKRSMLNADHVVELRVERSYVEAIMREGDRKVIARAGSHEGAMRLLVLLRNELEGNAERVIDITYQARRERERAEAKAAEEAKKAADEAEIQEKADEAAIQAKAQAAAAVGCVLCGEASRTIYGYPVVSLTSEGHHATRVDIFANARPSEVVEAMQRANELGVPILIDESRPQGGSWCVHYESEPLDNMFWAAKLKPGFLGGDTESPEKDLESPPERAQDFDEQLKLLREIAENTGGRRDSMVKQCEGLIRVLQNGYAARLIAEIERRRAMNDFHAT